MKNIIAALVTAALMAAMVYLTADAIDRQGAIEDEQIRRHTERIVK
jgi:hypothetical protein